MMIHPRSAITHMYASRSLAGDNVSMKIKNFKVQSTSDAAARSPVLLKVYTGPNTSMDVSFFKQFNPETGKFHRALSYTDDEHPRRIRGPITDHESAISITDSGGTSNCPDMANRSLKDAHSVASVLTDEDLRCAIRLLHKGGETSDKPSDWRPIGLLNVGTQLVHHVINYRLTTITVVENLIVPILGQDGGRAGRGVDLN